MEPYKISIKRNEEFKLTYQKNKFVLFIGEDKKLDGELPLHSHMAAFIKKFISKKAFKNIALNKSVMLDNPITLDPDYILIIKTKRDIDDKELYEFGKIISKFKGEDNISIVWSIDKPFTSTSRTIQLRSYVFDSLKVEKNSRKKSTETIFFVNEKFKYSKSDLMKNDALAEGVFLCRDLVNFPANILNTNQFEKELKKLNKVGIKVKVLNEKDIKAIGMNLLFAVGKGSENPSKVVVLEWNGGKKGAAPTALVGKGVVFDSGGLSL